MVTSDRSRYVRHSAGDLIDRVMQLRRVLAGVTTDNAELRRELMRLKQANQTLEGKLKVAAHRRH